VLEVLKSIILDFQEAAVASGIPRRQRVEPVPGKATVCIGVRRCGKSTYLYQMIGRLLNAGVPRENILYVNFIDDRLHGLRRENIGLVAEAYYSIYPDKKGAETVYCFFDEIQVVDGWESFVERMIRTEKCEVCLTGSSATMLSKEIATQMRGRALSWEIFPFSFREFLDARGIDADGALSTKQRLVVQKAFEEYREIGGFPEVAAQPARDGIAVGAAMPAHLRVKTHQEYLQAILFRDLVERHDVSHPRAVSDLAHRLIDNVGSPQSVSKLAGYLKSLGHGVSRPSVSDYLEWFEDAYFIFGVRIFDASLARTNANPRKVYCIDHSLVVSVASGVLANTGHLLENIVFVALRRFCPDVRYYRTKGGREVDFIVSPHGRPRRLVQVCESIADPQTRKREVAALEEAMAEVGLDEGVIVTRREHESIETDVGRIAVTPVWRFLLDLPDSAE